MTHTEIAIQRVLLPLGWVREDVGAGRLTMRVARERFEALKPTPQWAETMGADFDAVLAAYEAEWAEIEAE